MPRPASSLRVWPLVVGLLDVARSRSTSEEFEPLAEDLPLAGAISDGTHRLAKRVLDRERARDPDPLTPDGHHRHDHRRDASLLEGPCQHGHGAATVRSDRCQQRYVDLLRAHTFGDLRGVSPLPLACVELEAHEAVVRRGEAGDEPIGHSHLGMIER
jgi:hypothetical protein